MLGWLHVSQRGDDATENMERHSCHHDQNKRCARVVTKYYWNLHNIQYGE